MLAARASVVVRGAKGERVISAEHEETTYWFCCPGCRGRFARDPAKFLVSA